ncbi:NHLP leader peptide family RiPP precursor [uncultured Dokdonia sp.]|uniref:NHLP leader peptide family RiPP precursor n=1 Tax=uncultured Dokdonia sp. TaxID=575653 RepID=UPI00262E94D7|nr:NHLP leader peptide family RiPP precursor [uncultured Dokdonia sp.]
MELTREQKLLQTLIQKAWEDVDFKEYLKRSPLEAIQTLTGEQLNLPEDKTILVTDQSSQDVIYINIPAQPCTDDLELTEEQLEIVAGGGQIDPVIIIDVAAQIANLY